MSDDDSIKINLGKFGKFLKRKQKEEDKLEKERQKVEHKIQEESEELAELKETEKKIIDKEIKIDKEQIHTLEKEKKSLSKENISVSFNKAKKFLIKYQIPILLAIIILLQIMPNGGYLPWGGVWMRMQTQELPQMDTAAKNAVEQQYKLQITQQINQKYPHLPDASKKKLVNDNFQELLEKEGKTINAQITEVAEEFKKKYRYSSDGEQYTYMPDIDTYYYLRFARNYVEKGHAYDELKDGAPWDNHMLAPLGNKAGKTIHNYVLAYIYKIMNFFNSKVTLMQGACYFPIILILLSLIPAFFIGRHFAGNVGGFFTASMLALCTAAFGRTPWGHADTDAYNVFFPVIIMWVFIEAFTAKTPKKQYGLLAFTGLLLGIYSLAWQGWWYLFDFMLGAIGIYFIYLLYVNRKELFKSTKNIVNMRVIKQTFISGILFFISCALFVSLFSSFKSFTNTVFKPIRFTVFKAAAKATLWPNVYTTVAELNPASIKAIISSVGGTFLFAIAVLGVILVLLKKDQYGKYDIKYSALLAIWFIGTIYAATKGVRFTLLLAPAFSVAFGAALGIIYQKFTGWFDRELNMSKLITGSVLIALFLILLISPAKADFKRTKADLPLVNDAWWDSLTKIKEESAPDAIINSWWDFGHHFKYIADRAVTFDGGCQNKPMAHWIGHVLLTDNEKEAVGILRMLDCGSNTAFEKVMEEKGDPKESVDLLYKIIVLDKETAAKELDSAGIKNVDEVLKYTHCEAPENYFITSGDMIGKAGVWGHFGSWDFEKADIWINLRKLPKDAIINEMKQKFNYTNKKAEELYYKIQSIENEKQANNWISPWPSYYSQLVNCKTKNNEVICNNGLIVNLNDMSAKIKSNKGEGVPKSLVYISQNGTVEEKQFKSDLDFSGVLVPSKNGGYQGVLCHPLLAKSMFTRLFFMDGHGLEHFELFDERMQPTGENIIVWKVNWKGAEPRIHKELQEKTTVSPGDTAQVNYIGWLENGSVFDSSITDWRNKNISSDSNFDDFDTKPLQFQSLQGQMIMGFDAAVANMKPGEVKTVTISPEDAYGTDPEKHPLGNKTLNFKIRVESIK
ncbi:FKBP-type peptidyl-prolyl cis-trans isomerase [Candidatus Woesearchaeota archaeon]|nr:FKBP-type peptidyl-prolyl cis-trans isomerase [Candidatus Woesearchaeota archaeon]MBW3006419.1 FKBP-type peptidyl-prolyl cis-trans isomerase [Candidatus Woesearchaeota archaeon]